MKTNKESARIAKRVFLAMLQFVMMVVLPVAAHSASVALEWDASTDPDLAGYKVYYQANSSMLPLTGRGAAEGSAPIDVANAMSATINGLDPGNSYYFAVTAYNSQGMESVYSNVVEIPESLPPAVAITAPANNASVSGRVSVAASASDNVGVSRVQFFVNGVLQASSSSAPYGFTWDTASLARGAYTVSAQAFDAAGNMAQSDLVLNVAGDTVAPTVTLNGAGSGATLSGSITLTAAATDNVGVTGLEIYDNGTLVFAGNQGTASYAWNTLLAENGSHLLAARAYDAAGNVGQSALTVNVLNDSSAPSVAIGSPVNGSCVIGTVTVVANATDNVGVARVEFYLNGLLKGTATGPYNFSWNTAGLANGSYTWSALAYDAAGNAGQSQSVTVSVLKDTVAPAVAIAQPAASSKVGGIVAVGVNLNDNLGVTRVKYYLNGVLKASPASAPFGFNWNTRTLPNGSYTLSADAYDAAGNVGHSQSVTVTIFNDTTAPTVSISAPTVNGTAGGTVLVSASSSDNVGVTKVGFYVNGVLKSMVTTAPFNYTWNTKVMANGPYTLSARAYDAAGNVGQSASLAVNVFNDKTAPAITSLSPAPLTRVAADTTISAQATDNVAVTAMNLYLDGVLKATSTGSTVAWNLDIDAFGKGAHLIKVVAYDAALNKVSKTVTIYL